MSYFDRFYKERALGSIVEYITKKTEEKWWFLLVVIAIMILFFVFIAFLMTI